MKKSIQEALDTEKSTFRKHYVWIEKHMPQSFFEEFSDDQVMTLVHNLMAFKVQGEFIQVHFQDCSIVICLDGPDADLKILQRYAYFGIQNYQTFISDDCLPSYTNKKKKIRIGVIYYTKINDDDSKGVTNLSKAEMDKIFASIIKRNTKATKKELTGLVKSISSKYLRILTKERFELTLEMYNRAQSRNHLQYEVRLNKKWNTGKKQSPSMQIIFAWKNTHKYKFLFKLSKLMYRHGLIMKNVNAEYINPYGSDNTLLMSLALHGADNKPCWDVINLEDFLRELATLKYFEDSDLVESELVSENLITGSEGNLLRSFIDLVHQFLLHADINKYSKENVVEALIRHRELTVKIIEAFTMKFHPKQANIEEYQAKKACFEKMIKKIDTGNLAHDIRRKNILQTTLEICEYTLKTNFFKKNKSAICFSINPEIFTKFFYNYKEKFPEIPYGIFFVKGKEYIAFQIRFKDLSRGGLRTIFPKKVEQAKWEQTNVFSECYNLAYTQQKKNKDIPEGGSKAVIFIEPFEDLSYETEVYQKELLLSGVSQEEVEEKIHTYHEAQRAIYLYSSQKSFVYSLLTLVNCNDDGSLKTTDIVDYHKKPEYIYLGPDENMHNSMIEWIADYSEKVGYKLGAAFISSKPKYGINHKEYGVTSHTVNTYMHSVLLYLGIDPEQDQFTVKISGGPDGDVAGNQIYNLYKYYPKTAKVLAITDISGTIFDPKGLDLEELVKLFKEAKPLRFYPKNKLHAGGLLLDIETRKEKSAYQTLTLCYRKQGKKIVEDWLAGNDTHSLYSNNLHQVKSDIFIPGGGRPRTLNINNYRNFLDENDEPTSKAIVEGANLYLTGEARERLEALGVLIIKDSSANKGGVICSSLEVLCSLLMTNDEFLKNKKELMVDVLDFLKEKAQNEASLLLQSHDKYQIPLTELSDQISKKINTYTYQILSYLEEIELSKKLTDPLIKKLIEYLLPIFQKKYKNRLIKNIPDMHKKAIIACYIAQKIVYSKGLNWSPSIVDVLPLLINEKNS